MEVVLLAEEVEGLCEVERHDPGAPQTEDGGGGRGLRAQGPHQTPAQLPARRHPQVRTLVCSSFETVAGYLRCRYITSKNLTFSFFFSPKLALAFSVFSN